MPRNAAPSPSRPSTFQVTLVNHRVVFIGAVLGLFSSGIIYHYFGLIPMFLFMAGILATQFGVGWTVSLLEKQITIERIRISAVANFALIMVWTVSAVAVFSVRDSASSVAAMSMMTSVIFHVVFAASKDRGISFLMLLPPGLAILYFMVRVSWSEYSPLIAITATVASLGTVLSFLNAWSLSQKNHSQLQKAIDSSAAIQKRLEFAVEAAGEGYFEIDFADMVYRPNPQLARSLGWAAGPKDQSRLLELVHPDCHAEAFGNLKRCIDGDLMGWNQDIKISQADGGWRWMHLRARVLEQGGQRALIGIIVDISGRKRLESELLAAKEAAEGSSRSKSEFLANMSHEIRTPLNGVLGMAQSLAGDEMPANQREKVAIILDSGKSLMSLLNDVLDFSKIEAGKLEISPVPGDFLHTMKRTRQLFQASAEEKGLTVSVRYDSEFPQRIAYDPVRVRQCVSNLLSNAIKFTEKGGVEVHVSARPTGDDTHMVCVSVTDTGIGMSPDVVERLFSAFTQADGATTRKFGGTGLGLAISRHLARLMGGDITVTSEPGKGSSFHFTFRARQAAPEAAAPTERKTEAEAGAKRNLRGVRVLLTDDNAINRQVIRLFLAPQGCDITEATNGKEALDKLASQPFDLVLLDVHMPVMDGKEAIQRMRASGQSWSQLPVIALTADALMGDKEKYLALGMTDYLAKPVDQRELIAKMHTILHVDAAPGAPATGTEG